MNKNKVFFSYSQLGTYSNCPQKYKLIYIDKINKPYDSIEAFMGKVVHEVLEWLYNDKIHCNFDKISKKYDEIWDDRWHDNIFIAEIKSKRIFGSVKETIEDGSSPNSKTIKIAVEEIANYTGKTTNDVWGVASFYTNFRFNLQ